MGLNRKPTYKEEKLIEHLVNNASITFSSKWKEDLLVRPMNDDEMGSLLLFPQGQIFAHRIFGKQVSELQFLDKDGIEVIASLNVDDVGNLFELDIWKTDFSKLIEIPDFGNL